ncbi:MAG: glutamate--tRNA ligase [Planctomycetales bacterium]|nr:glutamate--tRNA ligase [Planctomycetales bacterium]
MPVRVRFAPSPTGDLHVGGARTALYNFLLARREGGVHILRIEDTDQARNTATALAGISESLRWLGIAWDEGPYYQSRRLPLYREWAARLEKTGRGYWREDPGKGRALVFRLPGGRIEWEDAVHGRIGRDISGDPDLVCVKSDGFPTYNFACVVDDSDLRITHVIRGDDHLSNTPKQIALYEALGEKPPTFAHLPLILNPDGSKMSKDYKKKGQGGKVVEIPTGVLRYRALGYLPEALRNFVALLGWSPGDEREVMTLDEMVAAYSLGRVKSVGGRFDIEKLDWMNGVYLRALPREAFAERARPFVAEAGLDPALLTAEVAGAFQEKIRTLAELPEKARFCLSDAASEDPAAAARHLTPAAASALREVAAALGGVGTPFTAEAVGAAVGPVAERHGGLKAVGQAIRVAVTGSAASPEIFLTIALVGRERAIARLRAAAERIERNGGTGGARA